MKKTSQLQNEKFYTNGMYIDLNGMSVEEYMNASKRCWWFNWWKLLW